MSEKQTVTLPTSGRVVEIRRPPVSNVTLVLDYQAKHPKPRPPMQMVKIMGKEEWVENLAHPEYPAALRMWQDGRNTAIAAAYMNMGVLSEPDEADLKQIAELRGMLGDMLSGASDRDVFIRHVLIQSDEDWMALTDAIQATMVPTEAQIANHADRFRRAS